MADVWQIAFSMVKGMTSDLASVMLTAVGSERAFFEMEESQLQTLSGGSSPIFSKSYRSKLLDRAMAELDYITAKQINSYYFHDENFPMRFLNVPDAPLLLYAKGECNLNSAKVVGIVGTRHISSYGEQLCRTLVQDIRNAFGEDTVIVSGLAYGVDVTAHVTALECNLPTVAVMAHGLDMIYPAAHRPVAVNIIRSGGSVLTEYPPKTRVHRYNFLARNRIIAALSDCVVVVESAKKGGALVTARIAQSYGRDVFAFPGRIGDQYSEGCHGLIRNNVAALITGVDDLAYAMGWGMEAEKNKPIQQSLFPDLSPEENSVVEQLKGRQPVHINELSVSIGLPAHKLMSLLVDMEFRGLIRMLPGNRYTM